MTPNGHRIAVVGATGAVGQTVLQVLHERKFPVAELVPFASERSAGAQIAFGDKRLTCQVLSKEAIQGFDVVISSAGGSVSSAWAHKFAETGALVIDKSSWGRTLPGTPLVVAGVNDDELADIRDAANPNHNIIASPNCSTMQLVVALKPIFDAVGIEEIVVSTYQSVSGTGLRALDELNKQIEADLAGGEPQPDVYPHQIAFNALPQVEDFDPETPGYTTEETKIMNETRRILDVSDSDLAITATCVRVPVRNAHSESVRIRTHKPLSADQCRELLAARDGIQVIDDPQHHAYPLATDAAGKDDVFVGRIRNDLGPNGDRFLNMWIVCDNLRKGAATNAVQIAQELDRRGLLGQGSASQRPRGQDAMAAPSGNGHAAQPIRS